MDQIGQRAALAQLAVMGEGREGDGAGKQAVSVEVGDAVQPAAGGTIAKVTTPTGGSD